MLVTEQEKGTVFPSLEEGCTHIDQPTDGKTDNFERFKAKNGEASDICLTTVASKTTEEILDD